MSPESKKFIHDLPHSQTLYIAGHTIHVTHYGIAEDGQYADIEPGNLSEMFKDIDADIIFHGHDHRVYEVHGGSWYINAGSLGYPGGDRNIARAGMLYIDEDGFSFENMRIEYDIAKTLQDIEEFNFPNKEFIKKVFYGTQ